MSTPWNTASSFEQKFSFTQTSWLNNVENVHDFDLNRSEKNVTHVDAKDSAATSGNYRDWNDEYQCCRELPRKTLQERIFRARALSKTLHDFAAAAKAGALAILHGNVTPINPMDEKRCHVYVHNKIFFSNALDVDESLKEVGDVTTHKLANQDLRGVQMLNYLDIEGLNTLATAVVDYLGQRIVAQSIIPGILQGEQASTLMYGSVDHGKSYYFNTKIHELLEKVCEHLSIKTSALVPQRTTEKDESLSEMPNHDNANRVVSGKVSIAGPADCKGIKGSDGRFYLLDITRLMPKVSCIQHITAS